MSKSLNECLLIGNVGNEPKFAQVANTEVAQFPLATSTGGYTKQDGTEVPTRTMWHNIVAWRGLSVVSKYIHKGDKVVVKGMINYREYEKDGIKHYVTDIVATDIVLTTKADNSRPPLSANDAPQGVGAAQTQVSSQAQVGAMPSAVPSILRELDQDLPF